MKQKFILVINAGSSSLKFKLFKEDLSDVASGIVEKIGAKGSFIDFKFKKTSEKRVLTIKNHDQAIEAVIDVLHENKIDFSQIVKVGHRVVHGGEKFVKPAVVNAKFLKEIVQFNKLAPLHNPNNIAGIKACLKLLPNAKSYAVFDTAFHASIPDYAFLYPLPYKMYTKHKVRRYGFHGTSHQYVSLVAAKKLKKVKPNFITCHLGSGCSITAIRDGLSVDTSMGFTPLEGLMMSTRSGDIDPAIIFYLKREGMTESQIDRLLNFESGLKGVSGMKDMRDIMIANGYKIPGYKSPVKFTKEQKYLAKVALQMFVYRVRKYIGAYTAVIGDVDAIVFTAGVGERNKDVRDLIVKNLKHKPKVMVIPTDEEYMIAALI
jgi:acetate kinase